MENTYLYVFSTIPQVIAAIIGFSSAFILLRINSYDSELKTFCDQIITKLDKHYGRFEDWELSTQTQPYAAKLKELTKLNRQNNINGMKEAIEWLVEKEYSEEKDKFNSKYNQRKTFIKKFKQLILWGCGPLMIPLIELPFAALLNSYFCIGVSLLIVTVLLTLVYLLIFILFLSSSIDSKY